METRIGDVERERAAAQLGEHVGAGRLDLAEYEQRVDRVYAARTGPELAAVLADLPVRVPAAAPVAAPAPVRPRIRVAAAWVPWLVVNAVCLVVWVATSVGAGHPLPFWPLWVAGPWGVMLAIGTATGRVGCSRGALPR